MRLRAFAALFLLLVLSAPALAETKAAVSRPALLGLAQQFVEKINAGFERADDALMTPREKKMKRYAVDIPDGEMLLLQIGVGSALRKNKQVRLRFEEPVVAVKMGDDVMVSLSDFFHVAQFAIEVKPGDSVAEGWYIRKNQTFRLDGKALTARVQGPEPREIKLSESDISIEETDILLKSAVLEELFGFESEVYLSSQSYDIVTRQKWPAIEKLERAKRKGRNFLPPPALPRKEDPYETVSVPNLHVSTTQGFARDGDDRIGNSATYNLVAEGDLLKHSARLITSGSFESEDKQISGIKAVFKRESENPDLLGWMGAHKYEFGDIGGGVGIRANNRNPYETSDTVTVIEGDITPGWDVELYRGSQFLQNISNSEGSYKFEDVTLSGGINPFRIVKYGPLGEIEEEEIEIYSVPNLKGIEGGLYNVSLTAAATDLWTRNPKESPDKYTPVFDGSYQWQVADNTSMKAGLSTRQQQNEQKVFPSIGAASYIDGTFLNADVTADIEGSWTGTVAARRTISRQSVSASASYTAEDFGTISGNRSPSQYELNMASRGRTPVLPASYALKTSYFENDDGSKRQRNSLSLSGRVGSVGASTELSYATRTARGGQSETMSGSTSLNGRIGRTIWRANADYSIIPDGWSMNNYNINLTRGLAKDVSGNLTLENSPGEDATSGIASLIWNGKYAKVSPRILYDSANNLEVFVNTSFGLAYNPYGSDIIMRGKDISKFGGVSAFVYLDRDGDRVFSEGDEPIQDAIVEAPHTKSSGTTDEHGEAFLYDLPSNAITDVRLNEYSFFDPYFVSGFEGVSVRPRPGHDTRIEFPVHNGGEMDGTIFVQPKRGKPRSLRNVHVMLYDMDGRLEHSAVTSFDGFYLFQKIHPGQYYLVIDEGDAKNFGLIRPLPEIISFGYEGTIIYGHNLILEKTDKGDMPDVPLNVGADYSDFISMNPSFDPSAIEGKTIVLNLGSYNSNVLMSVVWYKLKTRYGAVLGDASPPLVGPGDSYASLETGLHTLRVRVPGYDMEDAWKRCRALMARGLYCGVEVLPQQGERKEASAAAPPKG